MDYEKLNKKKQLLDKHRPLDTALVANLDDWFRVELTYTSNAIEGNTLTRRETALVVEKGLTVGGKSLKEHLEASNHAQALDWVKERVAKRPGHLGAKDILHLHSLILRGIDDNNAGHYRHVAVRISGSLVVLPNPKKVPDLMDGFFTWLKSPNDLNPVMFAAEAHYRLVTIHPFVDGNGRTARLLMNLLLLMQGFPPAIIQKQERLAYISALEKAQTGGTKDDFYHIINRATDRSLDIYLKAIKGDSNAHAPMMDEKQYRIGELAAKVSESVSTIRYWTQQGLLAVADVTPAGYQLYAASMVKRIERIQQHKKARLTLAEIKQLLLSNKM